HGRSNSAQKYKFLQRGRVRGDQELGTKCYNESWYKGMRQLKNKSTCWNSGDQKSNEELQLLPEGHLEDVQVGDAPD
ncbi:hypothetical protein PIB30_114330, partial [Stylosanthes scabra]|nr:hypothetical protein [Stylosanthes scabra]